MNNICLPYNKLYGEYEFININFNNNKFILNPF